MATGINGLVFFFEKKVKVTQLHPTVCDPMDCGILQDRILERVAVPFSRGSCQPRDRTQALQVDSLPAMPPGKPKGSETVAKTWD